MNRHILLVALAVSPSLAGAEFAAPESRVEEHAPALEPKSLSSDPELSVVMTELAPGVAVRSKSPVLRLFANPEPGTGRRIRCAVPGDAPGRSRVLNNEQTSANTPPGLPWVLVWFAGCPGWTTWDTPLLVIPKRDDGTVRTDGNGFLLEFPGPAGHVLVVPLYGFRKFPQQGADFSAYPQGDSGIRPWEWGETLPERIATRCDRLRALLRGFPVRVTETFRIEGDDLLVRMRYEYLDAPAAPEARIAPLPPALGLALQASASGAARRPFPAIPEGDGELVDPEVFTPYGPWIVLRGTDTAVIRFPLLGYVHQTSAPVGPRDDDAPATRLAAEDIRRLLASKFPDADPERIWDHGGPDNYCWQVMGDRWYAMALPFAGEESAGRVREALGRYVRETVLDPGRYKPFRECLLLTGPGIGTWGGYDDAGKFSANLLETLGAYVHYAGDPDPIRERADMVRRLFVTPYECDWKSFGRRSIAEMGDEAAPPIALARMAYRIGDYDTYAFASYIAVRELCHHYIKQVGAPYFRDRQPWHDPAPMPEEVYLTNLWGWIAGWQIDGPTYPEKTRERQYTNRWVRFSDPDVARFYRDVLGAEVAREMDRLTARAGEEEKPRYSLSGETAHITPSLIRLRALLTDDSPDDLARLVPPERWPGGRYADQLAFRMAFPLAQAKNRPPVRLIPKSTMADEAPGLERCTEGEFAGLCLDVVDSPPDMPGRDGIAPRLQWISHKGLADTQGLRMPHDMVFGDVAVPGRAFGEASRTRVNWNTVEILYR